LKQRNTTQYTTSTQQNNAITTQQHTTQPKLYNIKTTQHIKTQQTTTQQYNTTQCTQYSTIQYNTIQNDTTKCNDAYNFLFRRPNEGVLFVLLDVVFLSEGIQSDWVGKDLQQLQFDTLMQLITDQEKYSSLWKLLTTTKEGNPFAEFNLPSSFEELKSFLNAPAPEGWKPTNGYIFLFPLFA
jgi:hypothetical protein